MLSSQSKKLKVLPNIFSANLKTLDKATGQGIVWNYIPEEAIKKSWKTDVWKKGSENLSKIHSEPCQTSKMENFAKIVNYQKPSNNFAKGSSLDVW